MDLSEKVWLANEIRIWGLAATAIIGVISFAAALTHSRWQAELASQKEEIAQRIQRASDERIATAANEAAQANARAATANQKAEEEKLARVKIEERLADRKMGNDQRLRVVQKLLPFAGQQYKVTTFWELREPLALANQIHQALAQAQWLYVPHGEGGSFLLGGVASVNVYVHPEATQAAKDAARTLVAALIAENIEAEEKQQNAPNNPTNEIQINVGTKP